jgi:hypothetical protein
MLDMTLAGCVEMRGISFWSCADGGGLFVGLEKLGGGKEGKLGVYA